MSDVLASYAAQIGAAAKAEEKPVFNWDEMPYSERASVWRELRGFLSDPATMCLETGLIGAYNDETARSERYKIAKEKRALAAEMRLERPR